MQIDIDFEVFKELTIRRANESVSYNDVIRELLEMPETAARRWGEALAGVGRAIESTVAPGFSCRGLFLPDGTMLQATYKNRLYSASIVKGQWVDEAGVSHSSPSAAARHITGTNVNGWRFWDVQRPNDLDWLRMDALSISAS